MAERPNPLGEYVRARRALVTPEEAGLPSTGVRRVPGLRREEVALLAGISADYYLRLEQGRDRNPSAQVLTALARALRLDADATAHLLRLGAAAYRPEGRGAYETVPPGTERLVAALPMPAFVESRRLDILAANAAATALSPRLAVGGNRLRDAFLDPADRALYPDWESATEELVAGFRESVAAASDDPRCAELVRELTLASPRFGRLWARHDVHVCTGGPLRVDHPEAGRLLLDRERLAVAGTAGQTLVVYHPDPGGESAAALARLTGAAADTGGRGPRGVARSQSAQ
ncbi:helix-turn-helix domain-containing protein [Streptomyces tremellae]|uniref:Helix-turn-helix transcriptional regulator n=1 Tax=Streptomyces tremellae TaxID=1124239 RepID=A0ABP7FG53_9ACTN